MLPFVAGQVLVAALALMLSPACLARITR